MKEVITFGVGEPDFKTPKHIVKYALQKIKEGETSYTSNRGLFALRKAISEYLVKRFNTCHYDPKTEILITVGVSEAVDLVIRSITNPGDSIIIHEPCYVCYEPLIRLAGGKVIKYKTTPTNNFKIDPEKLEKIITPDTKALITNFPCNPTGTTYDKNTLLNLLELAKKYNFYIIADELYAELTYDTKHISFSSLPEAKEHVILVSGFSKAFAMTGWRIGYLCAHRKIIDTMVKIHQYNILCAPTMSQWAGYKALTSDFSSVEYMKKQYKERRDIIFEAFVDMGLEVVKPQGAFYIYPSIEKLKISAQEFSLKLLEDYKVAVVPGDAFGEGYENFIRCAYTLPKHLLIEGLNRIKDFVKKLNRR